MRRRGASWTCDREPSKPRCGRLSCPVCEAFLCVTPTGSHLKPHRSFLAPRMPEHRWLHEASPYPWPLAWQARKPRVCPVETVAETIARQRRYKPAGYSWTIEPAHTTKRGT